MALARKPVCINDFEVFAKEKLTKSQYEYLRGGTEDEVSLNENINAFRRLCIRPRYLRDVSNIELATTLLGAPVSCPIGLAPSAHHCLVDPADGEIGAARAACTAGMCFTQSSFSNKSVLEVAAAVPTGLKWFQLYVMRDEQVTMGLIRLAESAGFKALVVTCDVPVLSRRRTDVIWPLVLPSHLCCGNFDAIQSASSSTSREADTSRFFSNVLIHPALTWTMLERLAASTKLPIVLKGVMSADDARLAVKHGVSAVWVSNHGARHFDSLCPTIDVLPEIVAAIGHQVEVYVDSGFRTGTDILKGLALGARAVFIGRPVQWGLAYGGSSGLTELLDLLRVELELAMGLSGCASARDFEPGLVFRRSCCSRL
ncbi:PREDICTED: hydroxyacid oxidase 2-like [Priapulus caudatus]|uniref:Hydroxyacid oxidase 2-like n=1 Tax=Priapulus caudatus TaxID=37621 RepID=A0ABM1EG04_PRICU|nr:PREDICTED: hydroxyacid oxidase 2-like [Priapulus caudatus]XP_014671124.1 PREDICTED: hydroxyacid oxidase 2-like [Priapulus caudatus]XP_014671125.1 PREDICTED: hydroxyacid oxidase 2-like [Priapulus caudatus]